LASKIIKDNWRWSWQTG